MSQKLEKIEPNAFEHCLRLRTIYVGNECSVDIHNYVRSSVAVCPVNTVVGDYFLHDLRRIRHVVIQDGI